MAKDHRAMELIDLGDSLYSDKRPLDSLHQEIAWQFVPDLADFTTKLVLGQDFGVDRMDGYPEQVSRELSNSLSAMLRPQDRPWFKTTTLNEEIDADEANARYLDYVTGTIRQGLYDPRSKFIRATKQADRFYVNFGQAVLSVEEAPTRDHLYFKSYHLRDCAWLENDLGEIDHLHRKEKMTARAIVKKFSRSSDQVASQITDAYLKKPNQEFDIRVIVLPADEYDMKTPDSKRSGKKLPYVICYVDVANGKVIREMGLPEFIYVVPRWHLFAGTQYAFSPATMPALADARMAQMLSQILLESGEKAIDPPILAKQEIVIGEPNIQAGGITWVDLEHDASLKEALDILKLDPDMKVGFEMRKDVREMLSKAFYIDKLTLPEAGANMTAYEVGRRLEEHVRNLLPLFEPMQIEYNTRLLDKAYATLLNMNKFRTDGSNGTPPLPDSLRAADVTWAFQSPIQQAQDQILVEYFKGSLELVSIGMQAGATANPLNVDKALKDALRGTGAPAIWRKTQDEMDQEAEQLAQQRQMQQIAQTVSQGAQVAGQVGDAAQKLQLLPPAQKAVQGSAQGSPELAGAQGLPAPDVGDQGPAQTSGGSVPAPWQQEQPEAVLAGLMGGQGGQNGQGSQPAPQAPSQPPSQGVTQLQPVRPSNSDIARMLRQIIAGQSHLEEALRAPREIKIARDAKGKITGATAGANAQGR